MAALIWTQAARLSWIPAVSYFEHRFNFLRDLEESGELAAFRVDGDDSSLEAKIGDLAHQVTLRPSGIELEVLKPDGDWQRCRGALELALARIQPKAYRGVQFEFQCVSPLDMAYDKARRVMAYRWYGEWLSRVEPEDTATLLDGRRLDGSARFQVEFGVIQRSELYPRIARHVGRVSAASRPDLLADWEEEDVPPVAVFADLRWEPQNLPPVDGTVEWLDSLRDNLIADSVELMESLMGDSPTTDTEAQE